MNAQTRIGVTGLAVMGRNPARNFARHGYTVAVRTRTAARTRSLVEEFGHEGTFADRSSAGLCGRATAPTPAHDHGAGGAATDAVIDELAPLLGSGDMIIGGGNAHCASRTTTQRRKGVVRTQIQAPVGTLVATSDRACPQRRA
ncbi:NAD(P)-binding domain-containing protein [Streptomyces olivaceus]